MTKPIELGATKAGLSKTDLPKQARSGKGGAVKAQKEPALATEPRSEAEIMALTPARARKAGSPKPEIIDQIGQRLRDVYNGVVTQAVPDRFLDLLQTLESRPPAAAQSHPELSAAGQTPEAADSRAVPARKKGQK